MDHINQAAWQWLTDRMTYLQGDFTDPRAYSRLREHLTQLDSTAGTAGNYLFYLAVSDRFFTTVVDGLATAGLLTEGDGRWRRVVIEKPFGHDLPSAKALNAEILKVLKEDQIYRIDHFLGKETVQNIMALRSQTACSSRCGTVNISITSRSAAETAGVERRGKFYENTGARHGAQSYAPAARDDGHGALLFEANAVRAKKAEVIEAIRPFGPARY